MAQKDWRRYYAAVYEDGTCAELCCTRAWALSVAAFLKPGVKIIGIIGAKGKRADYHQLLFKQVIYL